MEGKSLILVIVAASLIFSCNKNKEDTTEESASILDISQQALSEASGQASASEGGASAIASQIENARITQLATTCKYSQRVCSNGTGTIPWNSCSINGPHASIVMTGSWTETWSNVGDCTNGYLSSIGENVTRSSTDSTINFDGGAAITTDTQGGTAYDGTVFIAGAIHTNRSNASTRAVSMYPSNSAIHKVFRGRRGTILFDYYTVPQLTISGAKVNNSSSGLTGSRIVAGTITIYHNLAKYTATSTFDAVTWSASNCCFPTSGSISSTYTGPGAPTGVYTMTFTSTCGTALFITPDNGSGETVNLTNCQ